MKRRAFLKKLAVTVAVAPAAAKALQNELSEIKLLEPKTKTPEPVKDDEIILAGGPVRDKYKEEVYSFERESTYVMYAHGHGKSDRQRCDIITRPGETWVINGAYHLIRGENGEMLIPGFERYPLIRLGTHTTTAGHYGDIMAEFNQDVLGLEY